ncbi:MAG: hypothetical protein WD270_13460 [Acetobacterales bacterium]
MRNRPSRERSRERGAALLVVLWMLALLALVAVGLAGTARTETRLAANLVAEAESHYRAQAAAMHATLLLLDTARPPPPQIALAGDDAPEAAPDAEVTARDQCGLVDINTALGGLVAALMATAGGGADAAFARTQALLDWRDPDRYRRNRGAEDDDYALAGRAHGARDGLFEGVDELQQVLGIDHEAYDRLRPLVTVDCLAAGIDPLAAPEPLLRTLPGVPEEERQRFLSARAEWLERPDEGEPPELRGSGDYAVPSLAQAFGIEVRIPRGEDGGAAVTWEAVVWLTGDPERPFLLRRWQRRPAMPPATEPDAAAPDMRMNDSEATDSDPPRL